MKKKIIIILITFLCVSSEYNFAQINTNVADTSINHVRVTTDNWDEIYSKKLYLYNNYVEYTDEAQNKITLNLENIYSIEQKKGNRSILFGLVGAAGGFLIGAAPKDSQGYSMPALVGVGTALGFGGGFIIGLSSKKYKKIYYNGKFNY